MLTARLNPVPLQILRIAKPPKSFKLAPVTKRKMATSAPPTSNLTQSPTSTRSLRSQRPVLYVEEPLDMEEVPDPREGLNLGEEGNELEEVPDSTKELNLGEEGNEESELGVELIDPPVHPSGRSVSVG